ncbi:transposase [Escherichia coli]|uniref:transposase n=1 Tax=Escherichia coli TaxID=562 RepID=UPI00388EA98F
MIDVLGPEKRRRRTTQEKIAIVQQSFEPGMTVSLVARQHGVAASQLFLWRKQYRREVLLLWPQENRSFLPLNLLPP